MSKGKALFWTIIIMVLFVGLIVLGSLFEIVWTIFVIILSIIVLFIMSYFVYLCLRGWRRN